ncbi:MAG: hypothetical protein CMH40_03930 [Micrococcales bacterium]|nr:hypothetical protein [Micrococcales bacterium]|tara:strand:+ start:3202 stop:3630 length:429 start_codon:yes stop_codon:yes gene_type:complete
MIDESGSVFQPIDQSDMIARIESFDVDEDDHALAGPEPADTLMAPSVPPAPAPPAPASASASAPVPEADVAHTSAPSPAPPGPVPEADVAPSPAPVPVAHEPAVAVDPVAIMESEQVFREEDPALVYRTQFILGGPEATIGR